MSAIFGFLKGPGIWIFAVLAVVAVVNREIKRAEARGEATVYAAEADSLRKAYQDSTGVWLGRDSVSDAALGALNVTLDSLTGVLGLSRTLARRERRRADSTIATLADTAAAGVILGALDSLEAEAEVCGVALLVCDSISVAQEAVILDVRGRLSQAGTLIATQEAAIGRLQGLAGRGGGIDLLHIGEAAVILLLTVLQFTK